jgi:two-component system response regulator
MEARPVEILLVEDNPDDAELTLRALRETVAPDHVAHVEDGVEALEFLLGTRGPPPTLRVVLLDLKLPKLDGLEVLRRIRADARNRSVPVVVLTSSREDRDVAESYALGANSYIVKPVNFSEYLAVVGGVGQYWLTLNVLRDPGGG